jgi:Cof subfamily protein (haloacid dehalogenase superfamily)
VIRLLAIDIDGTLLDSRGTVPPANVTAVTRAIDAGVEVVLATGRRYEFARAIFEQLPQPLTLILSNGAIVKTRGGTTLVRHLLPRAAALDVLRRTAAYRHSAAVLFDRPLEGQIVYESVDWEHPRHGAFFRSNRRFISLVRPLEEALTEDPLQVMFTGRCAHMRALHAQLVAGGGAGDFAITLTEYESRDFALVDVIRAGCSKGAALRELARVRGIDSDGVMAIGDNLNDLPMLEFAGTPVVMANGVAVLRSRGWAMAPSNDAAGVAAAIGTYVLDDASMKR